MPYGKNRENGFTLIELLVVISIISLLSSIVFASVNSARTKARYARAGVELDQFVKAAVIAQGERAQLGSKTSRVVAVAIASAAAGTCAMYQFPTDAIPNGSML